MNASNETSMLRTSRRDDGVTVLYFDAPNEAVNTLKASFTEEFERLLERLGADESVRGLVLASAKKDNFIAGADITMLADVTAAEVATGLSLRGQAALDKLANFRVPVVAAIAGACLGGGLEIALACHGRVVSSDPRTKLGLPEVQLGILPGLGGTQRLPRLVGLEAALDLLVTGKQIDGRKAVSLGLADELVPPSIVVQVAAERALRLAKERSQTKGAFTVVKELLQPSELRELAIAENPLGRKVVFDQAKKRLRDKTQGNYPAPERILDVVRVGLERGMKAGLGAEAEAFGELVVSPEARALRRVFFAQQSLKKDVGTREDGPTRSVERVFVLGSGLMGRGIALVSTWQAGAFARLKDVSAQALQAALAANAQVLDERVERRRLTPRKRAEILALHTTTTDWSGLAGSGLVIEAAPEDLELKRALLRDVEGKGRGETIFASNTSSLPISRIAEGARAPERVIGMHYFSPVHRMPLLEVIVTGKTADWVTRTAVAFGKKQGKTVIVVQDGPGFYTTRILGPYLNEAAFALLEGHSIESIDRALVQAGFPVGPLGLLDEVGIDVGQKVSHTLEEAFGSRMKAPPEFEKLVKSGRLGRKSKKGFYRYDGSFKGKRPVDPTVYEELGLSPSEDEPSVEVRDRCLLSLVNEAAHCLGEGIVRSARDGDVGAIFGLGFPPFLGGPFHYVDQEGAVEVVRRLEELERKFGERFKPAPLLVEHARTGAPLAER